MKTLAEYLKDQKNGDFADEIGISAQYLSQILNRERTPSLKVAAKIQAATKGEVLAVSFDQQTVLDYQMKAAG